MLKGLFRRSPRAEPPAEALYRSIVAQARQPAFYRDLGVPDSLDGRFELIVLHAALAIRRLRRAGAPGPALAQDLFDVLFRDMDVNLREMGVGDIGVARRIKAMAQAFYGRAEAYETGLDDDLEAALARNLYGTVEAEAWQLARLAAYIRQLVEALDGQGPEDLARDGMVFPPVTAPAGEDREIV